MMPAGDPACVCIRCVSAWHMSWLV